MILFEPLEHHQNATLSHPDSSLGTKKKVAKSDWGGRGGHNHHFVFSHRAKNKMVTLQRFNESHWQPLTAFLLNILDSVSSSEIGAGIAASSHWGSSSKGTKVPTCMAILDNFFLSVPGIIASRFILPCFHTQIFSEFIM